MRARHSLCSGMIENAASAVHRYRSSAAGVPRGYFTPALFCSLQLRRPKLERIRSSAHTDLGGGSTYGQVNTLGGVIYGIEQPQAWFWFSGITGFLVLSC